MSLTRDDFSWSRDYRLVRSSDPWNFLLDPRKNPASQIIRLPKLFMDPTDLKLRFHKDSEIHKLLDSIRLSFSLWQLNTRGQCDSDECKRSSIFIDRGRSIQIDLTAVLLSPSPHCPFYVLSLKTIPYAIDLVKLSRSRVFELDARSTQRTEKKNASGKNKNAPLLLF